MLQARLGRRINEILMLDADPLLPLAAGPAGRPRARRDGRPAPLPADQDRRRAGHHPGRRRGRRDHPGPAAMGRHLAARARRAGRAPRYLFLGLLFNRNADRPYVSATLHRGLTELARRLDIRDSAGRLVDFQRTHRFRHTRATSCCPALKISILAAFTMPMKNRAFRALSWGRCRATWARCRTQGRFSAVIAVCGQARAGNGTDGYKAGPWSAAGRGSAR